MSLNKFVGMGRLVKDPQVSEKVTRYTLAIDRFSKNEEQSADFISCVCFGKSAEFASNYLHKGQKIVVEGRLQTGSYTNKDNQKVYTTDVIVEHQEFAESKNAERQNTESGMAQIDAQFENIPDGIEEELPFA